MADNDDRLRAPKVVPRDTSEFLDEREMDDTLDETFPASDPPSWTMGVDDERREPLPPERARKRKE
jgi:hypothetical protein